MAKNLAPPASRRRQIGVRPLRRLGGVARAAAAAEPARARPAAGRSRVSVPCVRSDTGTSLAADLSASRRLVVRGLSASAGLSASLRADELIRACARPLPPCGRARRRPCRRRRRHPAGARRSRARRIPRRSRPSSPASASICASGDFRAAARQQHADDAQPERHSQQEEHDPTHLSPAAFPPPWTEI